MYHDISRYLEDVRKIETLLEAYDSGEIELDTDEIEDILIEWEQLRVKLRDRGENELANRVYEKVEDIQERLHEIEKEQIQSEEDAVIDEAGNRLSQSAMENLIAHMIKMKNRTPDIGREHKAEFRLRKRDKDFSERLKRLEK